MLYAVGGLGAVLSLSESMMHNRVAGLAILLSGVAIWAGIRYLKYAEFIAAGRFLFAGLRPMLGAHVKLELLQQALESAGSVEECWTALDRSALELGYSQLTASLNGRRFSTTMPGAADGSHWQMRLNLPSGCFVNITQSQGSSEPPILVIPFVELLRRVLPAKLERLNGIAAETRFTACR